MMVGNYLGIWKANIASGFQQGGTNPIDFPEQFFKVVAVLSNVTAVRVLSVASYMFEAQDELSCSL